MSPNANALSALLIRERKPLLRFMSRYLDQATCEDVYQNIWFKVRALPKDPPILNGRAYLFQLARSHAIDQVRKEARQRRVLEDAADILEHGIGPDTSRVIIAQNELSKILAAAKTLPEPTRTIFSLNRFSGLTQAQVALTLGLSSTTVEKHIRRALDHLIGVRGDLG